LAEFKSADRFELGIPRFGFVSDLEIRSST
jgi:hypothetical protein